MKMLADVERVLAALAGLLLFTLNEVRMFNTLPRMPDPGDGRVHAVWMNIADSQHQVFLSSFDLATRWGLAGLTAGLALWALAETFQHAPVRR